MENSAQLSNASIQSVDTGMSSVKSSTATTEVDLNLLTGLEYDRPFVQIIVEICVICLLWTMALFGNCLVCVVIYRSRRLQSTTNYFVVSLACADLIVVTSCSPFIITRLVRSAWICGAVVCKLMRFVQFVCPASTMMILVCICVDRFYTILYPLCFKVTRGRAKRMIVFSWLLAIVLSCPTLYFFNVQPSLLDGERFICLTYIPPDLAGMFYTIIICIVEYFLPISLLLFGYTRVFNYIWSVGVGGRTLQRTTNSIPRAKVKMIKMILIVNIVIVVLIGPFYILQLWYTFAYTRRRTYVDPTVYVAIWWMVLSSGAAKPLIYVMYNYNFRRGCREVFCRSTLKCYRSNAYAITSSSVVGKKNHVGFIVADVDSTFIQPESVLGIVEQSLITNQNAWPLATSNLPTTYL